MTNASDDSAGTSGRKRSQRREVFVVAGLLACVAALTYANSFKVPMLLDDGLAIGANPSIKRLGDIGAVLTPPHTATTGGRPLLNLTFALNYARGGQAVEGYHAVNLLIHVLAGWALFGLARQTFLLPKLKTRFGAVATHLSAAIALLWLLHPVQTESVTYISQRAESLMGLCYLVTLYAFVRSVNGSQPDRWRIISIGACFGGMAAKQTMVTAPVLVLAFDVAFVSTSLREAIGGRMRYYTGLAASWLWLGGLMFATRIDVYGVGFDQGVSSWNYACTESQVLVKYLQLAIWPSPLIFDYGRELMVHDFRQVWFYAILVAIGLVGVVALWLKSRPLGFLVGGFFVILAPTSSFMPIALQPMAESRMYLPLAAAVALVVITAFRYLGARIWIGVAAVGLLFGSLAFNRNRTYASGLTIWADTLGKHSANSRGHNNLAQELAAIPGRSHEAISHYETALRIRPDNAEFHYNLATELAKQPQRTAEALAHYETALQIKPDFADAHNNVALLLARTPGGLADAVSHYEAALRIKPDSFEAHNNLALALLKRPGRLDEALAHFERALQINPDYADAHSNLANELAAIPGRSHEAISHHEMALRIRPDDAMFHYNLATALAKQPQRTAEAVAHYEMALRIKPDFAEAHNNLALLLAATPGRLEEALGHYDAALRIKPDFAEAHSNLALALVKMPGRLDEALAHVERALQINPNYAEAHSNLANELAAIPGRSRDAISHYEMALRIRPDDAEVHYNLATELAMQPQWVAEALVHYEAALQIKPDFADAHNNMALLLAGIPGRLPDAVSHYEAALRIKPNFFDAHNNLGFALAQIPGRETEARTHYEEALRLKPDFVLAHNNLAGLFIKSGRLDEAMTHLEAVSQANPADENAQANLRKLRAAMRQ